MSLALGELTSVPTFTGNTDFIVETQQGFDSSNSGSLGIGRKPLKGHSKIHGGSGHSIGGQMFLSWSLTDSISDRGSAKILSSSGSSLGFIFFWSYLLKM